MAQNPTQLLAEAMADVAAVLIFSAALAPVFRRLRQPQVIAEILAGIALGPSLLGLLPGNLPARLFPVAGRTDLSAIAQVGILLFMFLIGWQMSPGEIRRSRNSVVGVSLSSIALPFAAGIGLATWLYHDHTTVAGHHVGETAFTLFVGTAMAITAFPVLARIILEHRLQATRVGTLALASAAVGDVLAWCMLSVISAVAASSGSGSLLRIVGWSALYVAVLALVVRPLLKLLVDRMSSDGDVSPLLLGILAGGAFVAGYVTNQIGLDAIFGAFSFGLVMPREAGYGLQARVREPMEHITTLLLPVFFVSTGLSVDVTQLGGGGWLQLAAIAAVACAGKLIGATGAARLSGLSWRDSRTVGFLMNTRGLTELIILNAGVTMGVLDHRMFTMMVIMALVTTAMAGPFVPRLPEPEPAARRLPSPVGQGG
ncbi:transporter, CPA2 family [Actinacidiphila yanglinensis]|uniref:Transporter, CPA2 family n=1 Tax=Actinacidiphila yanglinensis TaxID=310779 RepID=A0A1H5ZJ75_9ACTN|nr:cation:proton antiporter [Actinacidiphila yanglinensis]SEG36499.1 transporter, CPA2 family [Actinacidiphila yanglinensis]